MENAEENCEKRWKIQRKSKLNSEKIEKMGGGGGRRRRGGGGSGRKLLQEM